MRMRAECFGSAEALSFEPLAGRARCSSIVESVGWTSVRAGLAVVLLCVSSCGAAPREQPRAAAPPIAAAIAPATPEPERLCTAGAVRDAEDGCNTCTCAADGHWTCGELPCPACREPYTGTDATIAPQGRKCDAGEVWVRHPEAR